jgi:hypothetical protein
MMDAPELRKRNLLKKYLLGDARFLCCYVRIEAARKN